MKILITGGTGLIGKALIEALHQHSITVLTRNPDKARSILGDGIQFIENLDALPDFNTLDVVINLAGEPIINKRWTEQQKGIICSSRWGITEKLVEKIQAADQPPKVFISGSAVGYYGEQGRREVDESIEIQSSDFPHYVCSQWEAIAQRAESEQTRVCILRTGIVLSKKGGALKKLLPLYQVGLGGRVGSGEQYFPWIHIDDMVQGILYLIDHQEAKGIFNFTAPQPVTYQSFSKSLADTLRRPHFLFTPAPVLKFALGESSQLLLEGQRALPNALIAQGYQFQFSTLVPALDDLLNKTTA